MEFAHNRRMRTQLLSSLALVATLALTGCGGSDDDTGTTPGTDTGTAAADSATTDTGSSRDDTGSSGEDSSTDDTGSPATDTGTPATDTGGDTMTGTGPTFSQVYGTIIEGKCRSCHSGSAPAGTLNMGSKANAYTNLVGKPAAGSGCNGKGTRVVAGNAAMSILWQKVTSPTCGNRMPAGGAPALSKTETDRIKNWINAGALNN